MNALLPFSIPVRGLRQGIHHYHFEVDGDFFAAFPDSPVTQGKVEVEVDLDKRPQLLVLDFSVSGTVRTECDRCLATIDLPISNEAQLLVKYSDLKESQEDDVIYISPEEPKLDLSQYVYEYILLAMPIIKVYDCREEPDPPCNEEMLGYLGRSEPVGQQDEAEPDEGQPSIWDDLKRQLEKDN